MKKDKVVVLGGSGFIGREIVTSLVNNNVNVIVGCRNPTKARFLEKIEGDGSVSIIQTDVINRDDIKKVIQQADAIVSLVGILFESRNNTFDAVQANAPGIISEEAKKAGADVVKFQCFTPEKYISTEEPKYKIIKKFYFKKKQYINYLWLKFANLHHIKMAL